MTIVIYLNIGSDTSNSIITDFAFELAICPTAAFCRCWNTQFRQNFIGMQGSLKGGIREKFVNGNDPLTCRANSHYLCSQCQHSSRMIVGRVSMSDISTYCSPVSHYRVSYPHRGIKKNGVAFTYQARSVQFRFTCECTNVQYTVRLLDILQIGDAVDVD